MFLGHLISGFPSASIRFYAVLPIGIFQIGTQEVYSLFVMFSIDFCLKTSFSDLFLFLGIEFEPIITLCIVLLTLVTVMVDQLFTSSRGHVL